MRAVVYSHTGGREVLRLVERPVREPGPGEVRVKMQVSGVNPTDWKARRGGRAGAALPSRERRREWLLFQVDLSGPGWNRTNDLGIKVSTKRAQVNPAH